MPAPVVTDAEIVAQYRAGASLKEIRADRGRIKRVLAAHGVPLREPNGRASAHRRRKDERNRQMREAFDAGADILAIMRRFGVSEAVARRHCIHERPGFNPIEVLPVKDIACQEAFHGPELYDPALATTRLRRRLIERANAERLAAWERA